MDEANRKAGGEEMAAAVVVARTNEHFFAHTVYSDPKGFEPGDCVRVMGPEIQADHGDEFIVRRRATVKRAGPIRRFWVKLIAVLEITGLYEVSFSGRRKL